MHDLGDVTSKFKEILKKISGREILVPECKYLTTRILQAKRSKKDTNSNVLLTILDIMKYHRQRVLSHGDGHQEWPGVDNVEIM